MVLVSFVILPILNRYDIGPFFRWELFSGPSPRPYHDVLVERDGQEWFVSDGGEREFPARLRHMMWKLVQSSASADPDNQHSVQDAWQVLIAELQRQNFRVMELCRVKIEFPIYMTMNHEEKKRNCEKVDAPL